MHAFKGEASQGAKAVASRKLWHALHAIDKYLQGQAAWLVNYAERCRAGLRVGTSITEGTANFLVNRAYEQVAICCSRSVARSTTAPSVSGLGVDLTGSPIQT
jgi:hypothetical protein